MNVPNTSNTDNGVNIPQKSNLLSGKNKKIGKFAAAVMLGPAAVGAAALGGIETTKFLVNFSSSRLSELFKLDFSFYVGRNPAQLTAYVAALAVLGLKGIELSDKKAQANRPQPVIVPEYQTPQYIQWLVTQLHDESHEEKQDLSKLNNKTRIDQFDAPIGGTKPDQLLNEIAEASRQDIIERLQLDHSYRFEGRSTRILAEGELLDFEPISFEDPGFALSIFQYARNNIQNRLKNRINVTPNELAAACCSIVPTKILLELAQEQIAIIKTQRNLTPTEANIESALPEPCSEIALKEIAQFELQNSIPVIESTSETVEALRKYDDLGLKKIMSRLEMPSQSLTKDAQIVPRKKIELFTSR